MKPKFCTAIPGICFLVLLGTAVCAAAPQASVSATINPLELVRKAVENEARAANDNTYYMYRTRKETPKSGVELKQYVETTQGTVGRILAYNDKPLDAAQRQAEDERLQRIIDDPKELAKKRQAQKQDSDRVTRMVKTLPDAFIYHFESKQTAPNGHEIVKLKFTPNPNFDPPSREQQVFTGMDGTMLIDATAERIAEINGTLFRDVGFGWGILGHLDKGGRFIVTQADVGDGHWQTVRSVLNFTGRALIFHAINIKSTETSSDFHRLPNNLTFAQGVDLSKKQEATLAENHTAKEVK
jgi:hypothetical protein